MSIHFAAARNCRVGIFARCLGLPIGARAANDNADTSEQALLLRASLELFAEHGLGTAQAARAQAEEAWLAGRQDDYRHGLAVCRMFDRRMAAALERQLTKVSK